MPLAWMSISTVSPFRRSDEPRRGIGCPSRIEAELGWRPQVIVQEGWRRTVAWCISHQAWWGPLLAHSGGL